tara:strand:- start:16 stop:774 length:759 start_codon:yes stop_codon:yes gene_type:complete
MAFKLGDKRVNPLKSRGFMNTSPFKSNGNTMAYANGEPEGEDKKPVKTQEQLDAEAKKKAKDNMKVVKTETKKVDGGTQTTEFLEGEGKSTGFSKDPVERAKQDKWIEDNPELYKKMLADKKLKDQRITFKPDGTPEVTPEPNPRQTAKPTAAEVGQNLKNQMIMQFKGKKVYDSETEKMRPFTEEEIMQGQAGPLDPQLFASYNEHVAGMKAANAENKSTIGVTGDQQELDNVVDDQLEAKTNRSNTVNKQ